MCARGRPAGNKPACRAFAYAYVAPAQPAIAWVQTNATPPARRIITHGCYAIERRARIKREALARRKRANLRRGNDANAPGVCDLLSDRNGPETLKTYDLLIFDQ